jgi:exo-beta-1,3-glucanase (GH17 family)
MCSKRQVLVFGTVVLLGLSCPDDSCSPADEAVLEITAHSPWGSFDGFVAGAVRCVTPSEVRALGVIRVTGSWWVKPYANKPLTPISFLSRWRIDTTTGGVDYKADAVIVFLVSKNYSVPSILGVSEIPPQLFDDALSYDWVQKEGSEPVLVQSNVPGDTDTSTDNGTDDDVDNSTDNETDEEIDSDGDGVPDESDNCPDVPNAIQADDDGDGKGNACDNCPNDGNNDIDDDGICGNIDNCPETPNPDQGDGDNDGNGDACDPQAQLVVVNGSGSGSYDVGTTVTIEADVPSSHMFDQWAGDTSHVAEHYSVSTTVRLRANTTVTATFFEWPAISCRIKTYNFGPFVEEGQNPDHGTVLSFDQIRNLIARIGPYCEGIRTFGCSLGVEYTPEIAKTFGLKVAVGIWIDDNDATNQQEIDATIEIADKGHADLVIVGSEVLLRGTLTAEELIGYINDVKARVSVPVTTADVYGELLANPAVMAACDKILYNHYPYWEGILVDNAVRQIHQQHQQMLSVANGKEVIVSEVGWPSDGDTIGQAVASPTNASSFFLSFVTWANSENVDYFWFEAFDEPWKETNEGPQGSKWGNFTSALVLKSGMDRVFNCETAEDTWSEDPCTDDSPILRFTFVPETGSGEYLEGQVCHVDPSEHLIAVYIRVGSGWWTKPYWANPITQINDDGSWRCDYVTGGHDSQANKLAAFLLPAGYDPPSRSGQASLPESLYNDSVAHVEVER